MSLVTLTTERSEVEHFLVHSLHSKRGKEKRQNNFDDNNNKKMTVRNFQVRGR